jgi:hypothetical protein
MARRSPYSSLPLQRRRSRAPVIAAILVALSALGLVTRMLGSRGQTVADDEFRSTLEKAAAVLQERKNETGLTSEKNVSREAAAASPETAPSEKNAAAAQPSMPEAMAADKVREEFEKAASVLRKYFQSPSEEALAALLSHPDQSMPRYRLWARKNRIVPAVPLRIGPQFGTSGSLLVTSVKMADGSSRLAALKKTKSGYLLDWESFSAWGESRFADLPQVSAEKPALLRVTVKPSTATAPVPGALSFTLTHPDERSTLAAYAKPESLSVSPAARKLRDAGGGMFTLLLTMSAEDVKNGWANIHSVVSTGWVTEMAENE